MRRAVHVLAVLAVLVLAAAGLALAPAAPSLAAPQECVESDPQYRPTQPLWQLQRLQPERVWPITRGEGVTVAVVDTGVEAAHPQLEGQIVDAADFASGQGSATEDCLGHGTMVAGIIAAKQVEGLTFYGVAPDAKLMALRQTGPNGGNTDGLAEAVRYAVDNGADIINVSITSPTNDSDLENAVRYAAENDVVVVAAAGNDLESGQAQDCEVCYPAAYDDYVLAVGAVKPKDAPADVSHAGHYVDVAAPGEEIISTGPLPGAGYLGNNGTSFAAPYVSGVAALVRSHYPEMPAAEVVRRLVLTADPPVQGEANVQTGFGVVNPYAAVTQVVPTEPPAPPPPGEAALPQTPPPPDYTTRNVVIAATVLGGLTVIVVATLTAALPRGRRRRWQPGRWRPPPPEEDQPAL